LKSFLTVTAGILQRPITHEILKRAGIHARVLRTQRLAVSVSFCKDESTKHQAITKNGGRQEQTKNRKGNTKTMTAGKHNAIDLILCYFGCDLAAYI